MSLRDLAFTGLGALINAPALAVESFNALSRRGEQVRPDDGTVAGFVERVVTRDVPSAMGHALGLTVESAVRSMELVRQAACAVPAVFDRVVGAALEYTGVPTQRDIANLRDQLDRLSSRLDQVRPPARHSD